MRVNSLTSHTHFALVVKQKKNDMKPKKVLDFYAQYAMMYM